MLIRFLFLIGVVVISSVVAPAQTLRDAGVAAFKAGDYSQAIDNFKRAVKKDPADQTSWYLLGSSYLKKDKNKDAVKALETAVKLDPTNAKNVVGLAFAYFLTGNRKARATAEQALKIDPDNPDAHYVLGKLDLLAERYDAADSEASAIISRDPKFASAYRIRGEALLGSFAAQSGTIIRPPASRSQLLADASEAFQKYLSLITDEQVRKQVEVEIDTLKAFARYFARKKGDKDELTGKIRSPLELTSKPRAVYTDVARQNGVSGTILLLITFQADGTIGAIMPIRRLGFGLDERAVNAARQIKFKPAIDENGVPVTLVKAVEYSFAIYYR